MRIERFDPVADPGLADACYRLYRDSRPADDPHGPAMSERVFSVWFAEGWSGERMQWLVARDADRVGGYCSIELPRQNNRHLANLSLSVAVGQRRRGLGTELLRRAAGLARDDGRTVLAGIARVGTDGDAFAAARGARSGLVEVMRVLDLDAIPPGHLAGLRAEAEAASAGYSVLSWGSVTPEEHIEQAAKVSAVIADAPRSPAEQASSFDPERIRNDERRSLGRGVRRHTVVARCDRTGELAGLTRMSVDAGSPTWGLQRITVVAGPHRGHRLGLLIKLAMLDRLARDEPAVRRISTDNADTNAHMTAINDLLGYRPVDEWRFWELDVADVPA
jgi:RimJ/RimL family protein N-acetyltransferase